MITKWSIENFKSFREKTEIELAPITVFAGANSSGKSTIIQSILLLKQTVQYAPATRALALNGPMLKLGKFNDVKNVASDQQFIGIGWEIQLAERDKVMFRTALNTAFQSARPWGRTSVSYLKGSFTWEVPPDTEVGPSGLGTSEALLQLQPKLSSSYLEVTGGDEETDKSRFVRIERREKSASADDADFAYVVSSIDTLSSQEMLALKPDGQIVGAAPRHFFPGQIVIKFDGAKEKAFRVAIALCSEEMYRYRSPNLSNVKIPFDVIKLFQEKIPKSLGKNIASALLRITDNDSVTVEELSNAILQASASIEAHRMRNGQVEKFNFLDIRPQVSNLLFDHFIKQDDIQRDAIEPQIPRLIYEGADQAAAYFIAAVRYLGPLRDEPRPIYPLEALANPTEVGYKGEHTAAVLELHRDRRIRYLPSNFLDASSGRRQKVATLHDAVVDWLQYVGVASEVRTSDSGKFGHEIQVQTPGVAQFHDLTNVGVGVSQVLPIIGLLLGLTEMRQTNSRNGLQTQQLSCLNAPMPGDDLVVVIDENGVVEAETLDAARDLPDLLRRVGAGIARIRSQRVGGTVFKVHGGSKKAWG